MPSFHEGLQLDALAKQHLIMEFVIGTEVCHRPLQFSLSGSLIKGPWLGGCLPKKSITAEDSSSVARRTGPPVTCRTQP